MCTIRVAKTKALISFAVTAKLICVPGSASLFLHMQIVGFPLRRLKCYMFVSLIVLFSESLCLYGVTKIKKNNKTSLKLAGQKSA